MRHWLLLGLVAFLASRAEATGPKLSPAELARLIDQCVAEKWQDAQPAPRADDAEFLRRVYLDLTGRIPRVSEARAFLEDVAAEKRVRLVERLLAGPQYPIHFGAGWRQALLPNNNQQQFNFVNPQFKGWIEKQLREDVPYDVIVREVLTTPTGLNVVRNGGLANPNPPYFTPASYYQSHEFKPENVAANVSRVFLGVRLDCAQCHDHPFARWSRNQFWEMAAFFPSIQPARAVIQPNAKGQVFEKPKDREMKIPGTEKVVPARFLDGGVPEWKADSETRAVLAAWVTSPKNPFFARTGANRLWAHLLGHGLIDPIDEEPTEDNPPSHPTLLQDLAEQFVLHDFDSKYLIRAIIFSETYQRTSRQSHPSQADARLFARRTVRGLSAEQLYDSLALAVGLRETPQPGFQQFAFNQGRFDFLNRFASQENARDKQTSIQLALALMNGKLVADATHLDRGNTLAAIADAPFLTPADKLETLFLATLSRRPSSEEAERFGTYINEGDGQTGLADILWVLLNSTEFSVHR